MFKFNLEKCHEYFKIIEEDNSMISTADNRKFSNGGYIKSFWKMNKQKCYQEICKEENKNKYPIAYEILSRVYEDGYRYMSIEQKCHDFFRKVEELNKMIDDNNLKFKDGSKYLNFYKNNHIMLKKYLETHQKDYPKAYYIMTNYYAINSVFISKCIEFFEIIENDGKMICSTDQRQFNNGEKYCYFWFRNYNKIYRIINNKVYQEKYPKAYILINDNYNKKIKRKTEKTKLMSETNFPNITKSEYKKMITIIEFVEKNKRHIKLSDKNKFDDNTYYYYFYRSKRNLIFEYVKMNKQKYPVAYNIFYNYNIHSNNNELLSFQDKLKEFILKIENNENVFHDYTLTFSDNTVVLNFWNKWYEKIYLNVNKELISSDKYQLLSLYYLRKTITKEEKIKEYIELVEQKGSLLTAIRDLEFSDRSKVYGFWDRYKKEIALKFCDEKYRTKYPNACILIQSRFYHEQFLKIRLQQYLRLIEKNGYIIKSNNIRFADNTKLSSFLILNKKYIENEIQQDYYKEKYPLAYNIIIDNKRVKKYQKSK